MPEVAEIWTEEHAAAGYMKSYGVTYADGSKETLGSIDGGRYSSEEEYHAALYDLFAAKGVDVDWLAQRMEARARALRMSRLRQAFLDALANDAVFGRGIPGSDHYQRTFFQDAAGTAFADRDFGRWQDKATPPNPERIKALNRCRDLKRLRDSTTYPGEKRNAQDAMDKLQAKHGIKDREI